MAQMRIHVIEVEYNGEPTRIQLDSDLVAERVSWRLLKAGFRLRYYRTAEPLNLDANEVGRATYLLEQFR